LKPDDASYINNYALALARGKKFNEAQQELEKAATLDPTNGGKYFYNLGALLTNAGQTDAAGAAFKRAIESDPDYADAQYQYGIYLTGKAVTKPDGSLEFPPGTSDAFQKYVSLKPDGPFAESAKGMLQAMGQKVDTTYQNPAAKKATPAAKPAPKKK
jgi:tetratricopeptide (TPR) repeat protein